MEHRRTHDSYAFFGGMPEFGIRLLQCGAYTAWVNYWMARQEQALMMPG
jgi:hypothetical protein